MIALSATPVAAQSPAPAIATYHALTSVSPRCRGAERADDIIVCGRRGADRWRVPFVEPTAGDPGNETVMGERERLQAKSNQCLDRGPFLIGCGMAGVGMVVGLGGQGVRMRPLAP